MSPRTGRPPMENPKSNPIHVRMDNATLKILDAYCAQENVTRTEGIRRGVCLLEDKIKK